MPARGAGAGWPLVSARSARTLASRGTAIGRGDQYTVAVAVAEMGELVTCGVDAAVTVDEIVVLMSCVAVKDKCTNPVFADASLVRRPVKVRL